MSDTSQGHGWWIASDDKWYPPEQHPDYVAPAPPSAPTPAPTSPAPVVGSSTPNFAAETIAIPAGTTPPIVPEAVVNPGPTFAPAGAATESFTPGQSIDPVYDLPAAETPAASRRSLILGIGAVVLVVGLGFLTFRFFSGGSGTGASSPEAAVQQLVDSINERDAVGAVAVFDPDEVDAWFGSFAPAFNTIEEIDVAGEPRNDLTEAYEALFESFDYSVGSIAGGPLDFDVIPLDQGGRISRVRINDLKITINAPGAQEVAVIGAFDDETSAFDLSVIDGVDIELVDEGRGIAAQLMVPDTETSNEFAENAHLDFVTVQKDGQWYISPGYSFLEIIRNQPDAWPGVAQPEFGRGFDYVDNQTGGSDTAENVVRDFFTAFEDLDYDTMIRLTDPYGTPYLHDYQPVIDEQVDERDRRDAAAELGARIDELELGTSEWEGRTLVTFTEITGQIEGGNFRFDATTWCGSATPSDGGDRVEGCLEEVIAEALAEVDSSALPSDFIPDEVGMIVVERNGRWYLDPLATMGFYTSQLSDTFVSLADEFEGDTVAELSEFVITSGPIARQGMPVTTSALSGSAGIAMDLQGYTTVSNDFDEAFVALARVTSTGTGSYVYRDPIPMTGADWFVVYEDTYEDNNGFPAIAALTDDELSVELFEVQTSRVGSDGFTGQFGGEGRPQVIYFEDSLRGLDLQVDGARVIDVSGFDDNGIVLGQSFEFFDNDGLTGSDLFAVVIGEPGATFEVSTRVNEPALDNDGGDDEPPAFSDLGDFRADFFADIVADDGFDFAFDQSGGYFDGCGPNDPDVTSYAFQDRSGDTIVITPYPDQGRAEAAFEALRTVAEPCLDFDDLQVITVDSIDANNVRITWRFPSDANDTIEHYVLRGDTVLVATGTDVGVVEDQLRILDQY